MPTYSYRCTQCEHRFDVFQKFSDAPVSECPECGAPVRKVFHPAGVVFKGSGWYITDSRGSSPSNATASKSDDAGTSDATDAAKPETAKPEPAKPESKTKVEPAAKTAAAD